MNYSTQTEEEVLVEEKVSQKHSLIIFNDDVTTFDFVIDCLVELCDHDPIQAEQCTTLIHYKGKCDVKSGGYKELEPICTAFLDRGITAEIQ